MQHGAFPTLEAVVLFLVAWAKSSHLDVEGEDFVFSEREELA